MSCAYISVNEVAERLGVSKMTAYRLIDSRVITYVRVGRQYRIPVREFERYLDEHTEERLLDEAVAS
jgi:excisionase family DNA binding protein